MGSCPDGTKHSPGGGCIDNNKGQGTKGGVFRRGGRTRARTYGRGGASRNTRMMNQRTSGVTSQQNLISQVQSKYGVSVSNSDYTQGMALYRDIQQAARNNPSLSKQFSSLCTIRDANTLQQKFNSIIQQPGGGNQIMIAWGLVIIGIVIIAIAAY